MNVEAKFIWKYEPNIMLIGNYSVLKQYVFVIVKVIYISPKNTILGIIIKIWLKRASKMEKYISLIIVWVAK